jgi:alkanesulfonate monooxygenase SsuD/methylene tetrahydromethanopterin reductase-like flavin-dependent oxidoreductase (luciferase family)
MKFSYLCSASYDGPGPGMAWPAPPSACDRETAQLSVAHALENARLAEAAGFDWISVSEHHYSPIMLTPNPIVMAAALSQVTARAKIAVLGPLLPLNNPVRVAEEIAMLDCLTNGRVIVLFLRGTPNEQLTYGDVAERSRAMTQEGIELILKIWSSSEPFEWKGKEFQYKTVSPWPRTVQVPHPVTFGSGNSDESIEFAAKHRLSIAMSFAPPAMVKTWVDRYRAEADKCGWAPTPDNVLYRHLAHVADSDSSADAEMKEASAARASAAARGSAAREMGGPAARPAFFTPFFHGGPETVVEKAAQLRDCGVGILDLAFVIPGADRQGRAIKTFGEKVMPKLARM